MTLSTLTNKVIYIGNGSTIAFAVPFKVLDDEHLVVYRRLISTNEVEHVYLGTEYSYSGIGADSGTLTLSGAALSSSYQLEIERAVPYTQPLDVVNAGGFYPETVEEQLDLTTMQIQQIAAQSEDVATRALMVPVGEVAPPYDEFAAAFQGNPGGSMESVGLFTTLAIGLIAIPAGTDRVRTSGFSEAGVGAADYAYHASVNAAYVTDNPLTSFISVNGRGFRLAETHRTPAMFGCLGIRLGQTDATMTDDSAGLQAFFNDAFATEHRNYVYDFSGRWAHSRQIYACYPFFQEGSPKHHHTQRRFICGTLQALPLSRQAGGVAMDHQLTIAGHHPHFSGLLYLTALADTGLSPNYVDKRAGCGLRLFNAGFARFDSIVCEGHKRDSVYFDPAIVPTTFQTGTDYEVTYTYSNNIGVRIDHLMGRESGAHTYGAAHLYTKNWTAKAHGGLAAGAFDPVAATYNGSTQQRTRLTFDTTAEFRVHDFGKFRLELLPATYTTIAADNTAGTLVWAAGDPVTAGLIVGDRITPQSGSNSGIEFQIISFSGGSNRTIKVWPKPTTQAATALTGLYTRWFPYQVMEILSATQILVFPWMEDRAGATGKWTFAHGWAANVVGPNTANVSFGMICGLHHGGGIFAAGLYGPHVDTIIAEASNFGTVIGANLNSVQLGTVIEHHHFELVDFPIIQNTQAGDLHNIVKGASSLHLDKCRGVYAKAAAGDALPYDRAFYKMTLDLGGEILSNRYGLSYSGLDATNFILSNRPGERHLSKLMNGPLGCTLEFDDDVARLFGDHHWGEIIWEGPTGTAPTGDLTFTLSAELTHRGWTIEGTNPISGPSKPCKVFVGFRAETKKVLLSRFDAA